MSTSVAPLEMVDTDRYPLTEPDSPAWRDTVDRTRADLADVGCSVLADFVRPELHDLLRAECAALEAHAHTKIEQVNAYNTAIGEPLPEDHPGRLIMERGNAFVARDRIPASSLISRLYTSPVFQRFVADCFGLPELHELADPLSGLTLNVIAPGRAHPWHFDTNTHTVSMLTQAADAGGTFEYCPNIRTATDEHFPAVRGVLTGENTAPVRRLGLRPGDLQLFKGRFALHRVSTVKGEIARHSAIFAYSERPGVIGSAERTRQLFGRVLPAHLAGRSARGDELLD
ncbi:arpA protein [Amycolatopsis sp. OK19-0408]|uniref:ArpA protein n=1 Tax=Amycolatopsis iheyensis TaxID=2945988 RepID=A0A9X2SPS1_9PSEU|nr:arpA protein [Amycolatopsis iheyensis]MCR6490477.1 arpA protein [Amycolatopsis iheyensis]